MGQLTTLFEILDQTEKNEEKGLKRKSPTDISNKLLDAGFYAHAHEITAGNVKCKDCLSVYKINTFGNMNHILPIFYNPSSSF